jgi:NADH-quinone oxidoreductase subunit J
LDTALLETTIHPLLLYVACAIGALGVIIAMPRKGVSPLVIGGILAAAAVGMVIIGLLLTKPADEPMPNLFFHAFAVLALGGGLRMITHPKPVYSALYFILTIIASSGLYLLLSAEFMAFALIIIYAGAILITYLFVIMLATQAPDEGDDDALSLYDASAREPIAAAAAGFVLLALLTTMLFRGTPTLPIRPGLDSSDAILASLPGKVEDALLADLREVELVAPTEGFARMGDTGKLVIDSDTRSILVAPLEIEGAAAQVPETDRYVQVPEEMWPESLVGTNVEGLGLNLLGEHPMTIEIAGIVLLMAMLGATVLARKQVDLEEEAKARQQRRLALEGRR